MKNSLIKLIDLFFFTRPTVILASWMVLLLGSGTGGSTCSPVMLGVTFCLLGAAFALNQLHDQEEDRENGKLPHLWSGVLSPRDAWILIAALISSGVFAAFWLPAMQINLLALVALLLGWAYNFPPFRLKTFPLGGPLTIGLSSINICWKYSYQ